MSASGKLIKMEMDYSDTVDKKLPEYQQIAQVTDEIIVYVYCALIRVQYNY